MQPHTTDQSCAQDSANLQLYILLRDKLLTHPAKDATKGFNLQFTDVARQVERQCCPYYRSFAHNFHPTFNRRKFHGCRWEVGQSTSEFLMSIAFIVVQIAKCFWQFGRTFRPRLKDRIKYRMSIFLQVGMAVSVARNSSPFGNFSLVRLYS